VKFYSQCGQDRFLLENFFRGKRGGVFVDVGAYDGERFSNTLFFEQAMGWRGLCIEPLPSAFAKLKALRAAICENVAVSDFEGEAEFVEADAGTDEQMWSGLTSRFDPRHVQRLATWATDQRRLRVPVTKLTGLLAKHGIHRIDYCSMDTEGAELSILAELDTERFPVSVFTVENNYDDDRIPRLMQAKGYDFIFKLEQDYVFKRNDVQRLPRTSVICAVWHGDPDRADLVRGHAENLKRQTVPVEPIYVFDGGDKPPSWLDGHVIAVNRDLTIYQAWNVAISQVGTPLVMNLNLDDRLATDAIEILEIEILRKRAIAAGGDWKVCYSQAETDTVETCYPAARLPYVPEWPPKPGTLTRLGSGTGERGTLGPAAVWRMDAHVGAPRYPWRFQDGTPIRSAADLAWWEKLKTLPNANVLALPIVIGNYHSHPKGQLEFRVEDERARMQDVGISAL
jgi:FkbM family methyltransferase